MQGFAVTFAALVVDVVLANEAALVVPYCELVVDLGFDSVAVCVADVHEALVVVAFHLVVYPAVVAVSNPFVGIEVHVDIVVLVLPVL